MMIALFEVLLFVILTVNKESVCYRKALIPSYLMLTLAKMIYLTVWILKDESLAMVCKACDSGYGLFVTRVVTLCTFTLVKAYLSTVIYAFNR